MVKIVADTTSCLPEDIQQDFQIPVAPQLIHFGDQTFIEGRDMDSITFLDRLQNASELPKTAAPPPEIFREIFEKLLLSGEPILCIHPSTDLSGTVRSASVASQDFPDAQIRVIDTRLVASPLGVVVHQAAQAARDGADIDALEALVKTLSSRCQLYFLVSTLDYLARGGRIGGASALLGNALRVKPILSLSDGRVEPFLKERTFPKALQRLRQLVVDSYPADKDGHLTIMHAAVPDQAQALRDYFSDQLGISSPLISDLPPAIVTHAGPGAIAVGFFS